MRPLLALPACLLAACLPLIGTAQSGSRSASGGQDPSYRIQIRDQVSLTVFDEPDLSTVQRLDANGQMRIPLLGNIKFSGMTIRDAEDMLEKRFIEGEFLKQPMVTVRIAEYATREVSVLGAVRSPGVIPFPFEVNSMDIVDVISKTGGLAGIAKGESVRVTRLGDSGGEETFTVNVEALITGRGRRSNTERFLIYPGDVIYVPDRLF
jgi:polysaccharide export outer membrane protein